MNSRAAEWSQVKLRIPRELHEWLKHEAINNRRTLNGELEHRLSQSRGTRQQLLDAKQ